jgi:hypothetical protein
MGHLPSGRIFPVVVLRAGIRMTAGASCYGFGSMNIDQHLEESMADSSVDIM